MPTRAELQLLAEDRLAEAKLLLDNNRWSAAYYLAGYAVECGLKACIARLMKADVFPDKEFATSCYVHEIKKLVVLAQLKADLDKGAAADPILSVYWGRAIEWTEQSRYQTTTEDKAKTLYNAISDPAHGVMQWIRQRW